MKKVLEITQQGCAEVFGEWGEISYDDALLSRKPENVSLVVFTGGHDVWPELYGENTLRGTFYSSDRDLYESRMFELAVKHNIPMVGICRGSQFLCVKAGGKLVQDISGHTRDHCIETIDERIIPCNSLHHQMQLPPDDAVVLAWSDKRLSNHYLNGDGDDIDVEMEYEVVYYPSINAVGIQGHPEYLGQSHPFVKFSQEVVKHYLFGSGKEAIVDKRMRA